MPKKRFDLNLRGYVGGWNFRASDVDYLLEKNPDKEINVLIDSQGGDVATAFSISSAFRNHGYVNVELRGLNASAATVASMGAKHISIDCNAMYLVHNCSNFVFEYDLMNAEKIQQVIEELKKTKNNLERIDLNIASMYAAKCKKSKEELMDLMSKETWLNAEEALAWGFVDEIVNDPNGKAPTLDLATIQNFEAAGIPVPDLPMEEPKSGFLSKIFDKLDSLLESIKQPQIKNFMNKKFTFIGALLKKEEFAFSDDGNTAVTDEEMQTIENRIAALEEENANLKAGIKEKDSQIDALKAKPADESKDLLTHKEEPEAAKPMDFIDAANKASEFLTQIL